MSLLALSDVTRTGTGRTLAGLGILTAVTGVVGIVFLGLADILFRDWVLHNAVIAIGFGLISFLIVKDQPRNPVIWVAVWASFLTGIYCLFEFVIYLYLKRQGLDADIFHLRPVDLPVGMAIVVQTTSWIYIPGIYGPLTLGFSLFPDGRLPGRRWRWLLWATPAVLVSTAMILAYAFRPSSTLAYEAAVAGDIRDFEPVIGAPLTAVFFALSFAFLVLVIFSLAAMVVRYRRSDGVVREQFKWVIWGASLTVATLVPALVVDTVQGTNGWTQSSLLVGLVILLSSYGIAIGKYRLYAIDTVISRTVVLALLIVFITSVYALVVVGLGRLLGSGGDGLVLPIAATAIVAIAFEPVRHRAQRWANRLVWGQRATPYEVLADLTERLPLAEPGKGLLDRMAGRLMDGTGAQRATIWIGLDGGMSPAATAPPGDDVFTGPSLSADGVFPITHDGELVGAIELVKPPGVPLSTAERHLIDDLAGSAGAILGYERLNASLRETARELERSRARLVDAQDTERRRLERALHDGAQQQIVGLKVRIDLARGMAGRTGATDLERMLESLSTEAQAALDEVRGLARGIYPPVLESDGLAAAISSLASGAPVAVVFERDGVGRYSSEIEAAVYFDISEAVTNAVKHAEPPVRVTLREEDGMLTFTVSDKGPGFDPNMQRRGSGLENLRDRMDAIGGTVTVQSEPGKGTTVSGEVPLQQAFV